MKKIILTTTFYLYSPYSLISQWQWQNPRPIGKYIYEVRFPDSLIGYACGYGGMILKTTNGGNNRRELPSQVMT